MPTVTISLPDSLRKFVETQVETRGYGNVSEYFRGLLREARERESEKRLERLLLEGLDSGEDIELTPRYWSKKREAILAILAGAERKAKKRKAK
jgi:antitoxin ParD1/3/4